MSIYFEHEESEDYTVIECDKCAEFRMMIQGIDISNQEMENFAKEDGWNAEGGFHTCPDCATTINQ